MKVRVTLVDAGGALVGGIMRPENKADCGAIEAIKNASSRHKKMEFAVVTVSSAGEIQFFIK